jgi:hypothetical protein
MCLHGKAYIAGPARKTSVKEPSSTDSDSRDLDARSLYRAAVDRGEIPDTPLAEQIYANWTRFPDAILLTRVGKFYEVSRSA